MARFTLPANEYQPVRVFMASGNMCSIQKYLTKNGQFMSIMFI